MSNQSSSSLPDVRTAQKGGPHPEHTGPVDRDVDLPALNIAAANAGPAGGGNNVPEEMPPTPRRRNVDQMPSFEIMEHLRKRGCVPTGFYEDDKRQLQLLFDEDYEKQKLTRQAYMAHVNANRKANFTREFAERKRARDVMETSTALKNNPRVPVWLDLVKSGRSSPFMCWNSIKRPLVRHISVQLPVTSKLIGLEFCRCNINDEICEFVANMLQSNRSLRQLDLSENSIGAAGLFKLAKALEVNDVLRFIGLQGNPIRMSPDSSEPTESGVRALGDMLRVNNTLVRLDLLNTGLGAESFSCLAEALRSNSSVLILDADTSVSSLTDARNIKLALATNQHKEKLELAKKSKMRLKEKRVEVREKKLVAEKVEEERMSAWIENARRTRIQDRKRLLQEEREKQLRLAAERREAARLAMEAAMNAASTKKKKKGKKKKKKKK
eukprot:INCI9605.2.p1 GENE.INCI9605.2~~INCI9605.2.p1  ORF type:complete len:440 (+),score=81.84 INCI9605.2:127-1446(+)